MQVSVNGSNIVVSSNKLEDLLAEQVKAPVFAVAINGEFVAKSCYAQTLLSAGDKIEVLSPMQGG